MGATAEKHVSPEQSVSSTSKVWSKAEARQVLIPRGVRNIFGVSNHQGWNSYQFKESASDS